MEQFRPLVSQACAVEVWRKLSDDTHKRLSQARPEPAEQLTVYVYMVCAEPYIKETPTTIKVAAA